MATHPIIAGIASKVGAAICAGGAAAAAAPTLGIGSIAIGAVCWAGGVEALLETLMEKNYGSLEKGLAFAGLPSRRELIQQLYSWKYPGHQLSSEETEAIFAASSWAISFSSIEGVVYREEYSPAKKAEKVEIAKAEAISLVAANAAAKAVAEALAAQKKVQDKPTAIVAEAKTKAAKQKITFALAAKKKAASKKAASKKTTIALVAGGGLLIAGVVAFFLTKK